MSNAWISDEVILPGLTALGASATNSAVTREFGLTAGGATKAFLAVITTSAAVGTVTAKLQTRMPGGVFEDAKTATISASGSPQETELTLLAEAAADQTYFPLRQIARLVVTTAAASSVTITSVLMCQEN